MLGQRKFLTTLVTVVLLLVLAQWSLLGGNISGAEWVSTVKALLVLVGSYVAVNAAKGVLDGRNNK